MATFGFVLERCFNIFFEYSEFWVRSVFPVLLTRNHVKAESGGALVNP